MKKTPSLQIALATALCFELGTDVPEWVEVLPPGPTIGGRDGRQWTYDANQVIAETVAHTQGTDLPFDYNHATELKAPKGEKAEASGWAREYRVNERGAVEARVEWTKEARNAIESKEYRYISPVFAYDDRTGRIARFSSFALVNKPNLLTKALNSEQAAFLSQQPEESDMALAAILAALGLPETATEEEAVAAINKLLEDKKVALQTAANSEKVPSLSLYVPRQDYDALQKRALNAEQKLEQHGKDQLKIAINAEIEGALKAGKITPASKDYHLAACQEEGGLERFRQFVKSAPSVITPITPEGEHQDSEKTALNSEQQQAARMLGMDDEQYTKHIEGVK